MLSNLTPQQYEILNRVLFEGKSMRRVQEELGVTYHTVKQALAHPDVREVYKQLLEDFDSDLRHLYAPAIRKLREHIVSDDPRISLSAIDTLFKTQGKYKLREDGGIGAEEVVRMILDKVSK